MANATTKEGKLILKALEVPGYVAGGPTWLAVANGS
jgi:hypothetical protein